VNILAVMYRPLCKPLFDGKEGVIHSELHKKRFMRFMDPDFGNPLCFFLPLGINLLFFLPWHLLFFTSFIFIHSLMNFLFCIPTQYRLVSFSEWGSFTANPLKFAAFITAFLCSNKTGDSNFFSDGTRALRGQDYFSMH